MDNFFETNNKCHCNGCGACALICPKNCIEMKEDSEGFLYPYINKTECINCNQCKKICSNLPKKNDYNIKAYAAKNKNNVERSESTSGGMFYIFVKHVIKRQGVVFGVKYDENLKVKHDYADTLEECKAFSTSKYVRSNLNNSYIKVKEFLEQDRWVLFSGTPCQVYGLKSFLKKDYKKLILCDIICHANPSPKLFDMYIKNREKLTSKKVKNLHFRSKNPKMDNKSYIEYEDGEIRKDNLFRQAFLSELINRPSCNTCSFVTSNRKSDFTIGDFWGVNRIFSEFDDGKGVSLITVNSEKAEKIFDTIKEQMIVRESDLEEAFKYNHNHNLLPHKKRKKLFAKISTGKITQDNLIDYLTKYLKRNIIKKIVNKIKNYNKQKI